MADEDTDKKNDSPYDGPQREEAAGEKKSNMPFLDHIEELRWRIIKALVAVIVFTGVSFGFADYIFAFFIMPLGDVKLHFTEITGSFYAYLKLSFYAGIFGGLPIIFYQIWKFIGPGLYSSEKKMVVPMMLASTILFLGGASFCFFIVLPFALSFLIGYGADILSPIITVSSYISFTGLLLIAFGSAFQLPVIGYFLGRIGVVNAKFLGKARPYAIVLILIAGAVLSPPDVFTQILLAGPVYLLYELTIIIVRWTQVEKAKKEEKEDKEEEEGA